ncbi:MAG: 3-phosphoshikimate 1-carboxyvinyltransferase [Oscillospiraceae bacterium]|jgi:3-phosphoshikimate 1-carboxyvinyltransferase
MTVQFSPSRLTGAVAAVPSKSASHRAIICAALAHGQSIVRNLIFSKDITATIDCLTALGATIECGTDFAVIDGIDGSIPTTALLSCKESGSTLRFLIPVAAVLGCEATFLGEGRLPSRPITPYLDGLGQKGIRFHYHETMPFSIQGTLSGGSFTIPGNISSQFITGLLFALPLLKQDSVIHITGAFESRPYVQMTIEMLHKFGIQAALNGNIVTVPGGQTYHPTEVTVEGDFSQAAFFLTAGALSGPVAVSGLDYQQSAQGDKIIVDYLKKAGALISVDTDRITVSAPESGILSPIEVDARDIPDLVPILAVLASQCAGESVIHHAERLRIKESDRLAAVSALLTAGGAQVTVTSDGLIIRGKTEFYGCTVDSSNDHRIAMSTAVIASTATGAVTLKQAESIRKSYPAFYEDYQAIGGLCNVIDLE